MFVLGTAGHVDHGKSTLLRRLTTMEPDRLPEEKKRGMTIDLNFVWMDSPKGGKIGIVDVPGHQRFVKNMITGVSSIDGFIFVVAADDGWMPQSEEHLGVLRHLNVKDGIGVITKVDLASSERVEEVKKDVSGRLKEAFGKEIEVITFSQDNPDLLNGLRSKVFSLVDRLPAPRDIGKPRIWVDRVFLPKGLGVVVTGTLREGSVKRGDALYLWPSGKEISVKSVQSYHADSVEVKPNARVALQLAKIDATEIARGDLINREKTTFTTKRADIRMEWFEKPIKKPTEISFHVGTYNGIVLGVPLGDEHLRLKFYSSLPIRVFDKVILRTSGEERTLGVGTVLDVNLLVKSHKLAEACLGPMEMDIGGTIAVFEKKRGYVDSAELSRTTPFAKDEVESALKNSYDRVFETVWVQKTEWTGMAASLKKRLADFHASANKSMPEKELTQALVKEFPRLKDARLLKALLAFVQTSGDVRKEPEGFRLFSFVKKMDAAQTKLRDKLRAVLNEGFPLTEEELEKTVPGMKSLLFTLVREGEIVKMGDRAFMSRSFYEKCITQVKEHLRAKKQATTSELREMLKYSRKHVIFILEQMDRDRVTFLKDNVRRLF